MGEDFGNYQIIRKLATGGMAEVFLAKHQSLAGFERLVCIKRILPHLGEQRDFITMFEDEARIAANLVHPNIAQIYDIGSINQSYYIALEYVNGPDIRQIYNQEVKRGCAIPLAPAAQIIMGAASGLAYAHRQQGLDGTALGIVHRDISPQNILVTYDGHVKLIDFGVAKAANKIQVTRVGVIKGKYSYMSPEHASGDPIDGRTDIFALGVTLYEITTGTRLFKRDNELETLAAVIECKITPPSELLPGYDPLLEEIILRCLASDYTERYEDATVLERELERFLISGSHPTTPSALGEYMQELFAEELLEAELEARLLEEELTTASDTSLTLSPPRSSRGSSTTGEHFEQLETQISNDHSPGPPTVSAQHPIPPEGTVLRPPESDSPVISRLAPKPTASGTSPQNARPDSSSRRYLWTTVIALSLSALMLTYLTDDPSGPKEVEPAQPAPTAPLPAPTATVTLTSVPPGASVSLDGRPLGKKTPLVDLKLTPLQSHTLKISKSGYRQKTKKIKLNDGDNRTLQFTLLPLTGSPGTTKKPPPLSTPPPGLLSLTSPIPLTVRINGQPRGTSPLRSLRLPAGEHAIELRSTSEGLTLHRTVRIETGESLTLPILLKRGTLSLNAEPWARVQIGEAITGIITPTQAQLFEGHYAVVFTCPDGSKRTRKIKILPNQVHSVTVNCNAAP